jgi:hypothetical protein
MMGLTDTPTTALASLSSRFVRKTPLIFLMAGRLLVLLMPLQHDNNRTADNMRDSSEPFSRETPK